MTSDYQPIVNQRLDAHYEELIASEKEPRPERLEKVRIKLSSGARHVKNAERPGFRRQFFEMIRREYSKAVPAWDNPQGAQVQDVSDFPAVQMCLGSSEIWLHPLFRRRPQEQWVVIAPTGASFTPGALFKL